MHCRRTEVTSVAPKLTVSDFIAITNQTLEYAYPVVDIEGEVASFKVNQGKFVFFDIKDAGGSVGCFMMLFHLRTPIEDGMKVVVTAMPKLTQWGKFSLTVKAIRPSGEGSIKKSFELLKAKLEQEGLFAPERKRPLPVMPRHIGVISSPQAAGYADFIRIVGDRWGGLKIDVAAVTVQGAEAPDQIIGALDYFNQQEQVPEVIVIIRGGGSADDLSAFNDEKLVRAVAASRVPTLTGIGHEIDESLADLAADVRAATPSNVAQILVPDKNEVIRSVRQGLMGVVPHVARLLETYRDQLTDSVLGAVQKSEFQIGHVRDRITDSRRLLAELDPARVLERGYALVRGEQKQGGVISIETVTSIMKAEVIDYEQK